MRFPPFSVLLRGTLCPFSQISSEIFWYLPKLFLSLQPCRIRSNVEVRLPNVTHRQRHEVGRFPNGKSHLFFVSLFSHNSHSNSECRHINKKDTFAVHGKSLHNERFVLNWPIRSESISFFHTQILCIIQKTIKNESTTSNPKMNILRMSSKWSNHAEANNVKKPQL